MPLCLRASWGQEPRGGGHVMGRIKRAADDDVALRYRATLACIKLTTTLRYDAALRKEV